MGKINYNNSGEYYMPSEEYKGPERRREDRINIAKIVGKVEATMSGFKEDLSDLKNLTDKSLKSIDHKIDYHNRKIEQDLQKMEEFREYKHKQNSENIENLKIIVENQGKDINLRLDDHDRRIGDLELKPDIKRLSFYDKVKDKVVWGFIGAAILLIINFVRSIITEIL